MIDHIGLAVSSMGRAKAFYLSALRPLGIGVIAEVSAEETGGDAHAGFGKDRKAFFWIGTGSKPRGGAHVAFTAETRAEVDAFHRAAMAAGVRTMARLARDPITTSTITAPSFSTPTATTSKPCATGRSEPRRASWSGNRGLHFADGPEAARRDALVARFPEKFGWIHAFDALESARAALQNASPLAAR